MKALFKHCISLKSVAVGERDTVYARMVGKFAKIVENRGKKSAADFSNMEASWKFTTK